MYALMIFLFSPSKDALLADLGQLLPTTTSRDIPIAAANVGKASCVIAQNL